MKAGWVILAALAAVAAQAADPYVGYLLPCGIQAGTTNRIMVGGQFLPPVRAAWVSGTGVRVIGLEHVPNFAPPGTGPQRQYLTKWVNAVHAGDRSVPPLPKDPHITEWRSNRWWSAIGSLDGLQLEIVARDLFMRRNPLQQSPSIRQMMLVTVVADREAEPGVRDFVVWGQNGISSPRPLYVTAAPRVAEPTYVAPDWPEPPPVRVKDYPQIIDGRIMPGETDRYHLALRAGDRLVCRVTARALQPYIGDAVPGFFNPVLRLLDPRGRELAFADDWYHEPDPRLACTIPAEGDYTLEIRDNLYRGREDFVYAIDVRRDADAPLVDPLHPAFSRLTEPVARIPFEVKEPGTRVFDLLARRAGSPLDGVVTIKDATGRVRARFDDTPADLYVGTVAQGECDPVASYAFTEPGAYVAEVSDRIGRSGSDFFYLLRIRAEVPRVEVYAAKSTVGVRAWARAPMTFKVVRREGFMGPVELLPNEFVRFQPARLAAESNTCTVSAISLCTAPGPVKEMTIRARVQIGDEMQTLNVIPADEYEQAFAWTHLVPARTFLFKSLPPWRRRK